MSLPVVDCRSLVDFCKAYEQHRKKAAFNSSNSSGADHHHNRISKTSRLDHYHHGGRRRGIISFDALSDSLCDQFTLSAVIDILLLLLVIGAVGVLVVPYMTFLAHEASEIFVEVGFLIGEVLCDLPFVYLASFIIAVSVAIGLWTFVILKSRKCGKSYCKGLHKSVAFDIQLQTEQCVKSYPPLPKDTFGDWPIEFGGDREELEAELKKMAPLNGRTVLIFRAPCGCPTGRMEVWGLKKVRRIKK